MNELQIFQNPQFGEIRTITEDGVTLFCASDVAKALGYKKPSDAVAAGPMWQPRLDIRIRERRWLTIAKELLRDGVTIRYAVSKK